MNAYQPQESVRPSLEALVEQGLLNLESLHPGGLDMVRQLAERCHIEPGSRVLDVAAGTGETACLLAEERGARVAAVDASVEMTHRGSAKAQTRGLNIAFHQADAARLPFADETFDVAICECTLCLLDKRRVVDEMLRVVRRGGRVGMHDLCWQPGASDKLKRQLDELEGERPETLEGWQQLFADAGLIEIHAVDASEAKARWMRDSHRQLGWRGQIVLARQVVGRWGWHGLWTVLRSERVMSNRQLGYGLVVGTKP